MNLENFLYKKISLWIVFFLLIIFFIFSIFFGWVLLHKAKGGTKAGLIGDVALEVASVIPNFLKILRGVNSDLYLKTSRFEKLKGLNISSNHTDKKNMDGYL